MAGLCRWGREKNPNPYLGRATQLSPPSSHLSIVIAYFFYRCTAVRTSSNSSVSPEIAIRATMNNDRSSGGSSNGTTPPPSAGNDHEVAPPAYPTFGGLLDAEVSFDGEQGPPVRSAGPAGLAGSVGLRQRLHFFYSHRWHHASWPASGLPSGMRTVTVTV